MANHKSAEKRMRQSEKRRQRNMHFKSFMRSRIRLVREAVAGEKAGEAQAMLLQAISAIDRVASKGIVHANTASRRISRLTKAVNRLTQRPTESASQH